MNRPGQALILGARDVLAQTVQPMLHHQRWSLDAGQSGPMCRAIHLSAGQALLGHADGELPLRAPDVVWLPSGAARFLRVDAGNSGVMVGVSDSLVAAAVGDQADSGALRQITSRLCRVTDCEAGPRDELVRALLAIETEARGGVAGSWHYLSANLTIVLVMLWHMAGRDSGAATFAGSGAVPGSGANPNAERLQRFRHLVEVQFRRHWPAARYAAELGLSADRLHDLCVRNIARTPITLVHQRLFREACLLLSGSDLSIEQLAADLEFASTSHFSRFFKRRASASPKSWRGQSRALTAAGQAREPTSHADWP